MTRPRRGRARRCFGPLALVLLLVPAFCELPVDRYDAPTPALIAVALVPTLLAALCAGLAIGGRWGVAASAALVALAAYWAWWFGWGVDANLSPFSLELAAFGLIDASQYHLALAIYLWPLLLVIAVLVGAVARRRGRSIWAALGALILVLVVLAFPRDAGWGDGCNSHNGATPLLTKPIAATLMDHGVGVIPNRYQTMMLCGDVGDREWKPFWLGDDGLPPQPTIGHTIQTIAYLMDDAAREARALHVAVGYSPARSELYVVASAPAKLETSGSANRYDVRAGTERYDDMAGPARKGRRGWCYEFAWRSPDSRAKRLAAGAKRGRIKVTYRQHGQVVRSGTARILRLSRPVDYEELRRWARCRPPG